MFLHAQMPSTNVDVPDVSGDVSLPSASGDVPLPSGEVVLPSVSVDVSRPLATGGVSLPSAAGDVSLTLGGANVVDVGVPSGEVNLTAPDTDMTGGASLTAGLDAAGAVTVGAVGVGPGSLVGKGDNKPEVLFVVLDFVCRAFCWNVQSNNFLWIEL